MLLKSGEAFRLDEFGEERVKVRLSRDDDVQVNGESLRMLLNSMTAVPPLKIKGRPDSTSPSRSSKARMTFSIRILSALRFSADT